MPEHELKAKTIEELLALKEEAARIARENESFRVDLETRESAVTVREAAMATVEERQRHTDTDQEAKAAELSEKEMTLKADRQALSEEQARWSDERTKQEAALADRAHVVQDAERDLSASQLEFRKAKDAAETDLGERKRAVADIEASLVARAEQYEKNESDLAERKVEHAKNVKSFEQAIKNANS